MSHHLTSQMAAERQRDFRAGGVQRQRSAAGRGGRGLRVARAIVSRKPAGWRPRARRAERLGC